MERLIGWVDLGLAVFGYVVVLTVVGLVVLCQVVSYT